MDQIKFLVFTSPRIFRCSKSGSGSEFKFKRTLYPFICLSDKVLLTDGWKKVSSEFANAQNQHIPWRRSNLDEVLTELCMPCGFQNLPGFLPAWLPTSSAVHLPSCWGPGASRFPPDGLAHSQDSQGLQDPLIWDSPRAGVPFSFIENFNFSHFRSKLEHWISKSSKNWNCSSTQV